jgi:hypothetical protein
MSRRKLIIIAILIGVAAIAGSQFYLGAFADYTYESSDRGMADIEVPWKGRGLKIVQADFEAYKKWKGRDDLVLYRTSKRSWWVAPLLIDNITNERWKLPYMEPSEHPKADYFLKMQESRANPNVNPSER